MVQLETETKVPTLPTRINPKSSCHIVLSKTVPNNDIKDCRRLTGPENIIS